MKLIVTQPFGGYAKGAEITDDAAISAALKSNPRHVVKVATAATSATTDTSSTKSSS